MVLLPLLAVLVLRDFLAEPDDEGGEYGMGDFLEVVGEEEAAEAPPPLSPSLVSRKAEEGLDLGLWS